MSAKQRKIVMKKLMFAAAVMACIGLNAEITSQNVVGYAETGAIKGSKIIGAQFANVGTEKAIDLTDIKVTGYEESTEGDVYVQTLDSIGRGGMIYSYYDVPGELTGWLDGNDNPVKPGDVVLQPSEGLWVNAPSDAWGLQTAGEVLTKDIFATLRKGSKMVVNTTPLAVDLINIAVTGYITSTEGDVYVQTLDSIGRGGMIYSYYDVPDELTGWLDGNDVPVVEGQVMIQPGEGLWVNAPSTAYGLTLPGVEL